jgi:hypothetical protein
MLVRKCFAHALTRLVHRDAAEVARDRREVHVLEDAEPTAIGREIGKRDRTTVVDPEDLARSDIADELRADGLKRAGLARDEPRVTLTAQAERAHAERVADRVERRGRQHHERPRAAKLRQRAYEPLVPGRTVLARDRLRDDLGVAGR